MKDDHLADEYHWRPLSVDEASARFAAFPGPWWVAGGWAIDLFVGRQTRQHADVDILIRRDDQLALFDILPEWEIHAAGMPVPGGLVCWQTGAPFPADVHDIWCRPDGTSPWALQAMLMDTADDRWVFRRDARIGGAIADLGLKRDGIPYLTPEVQLLYKSKNRLPKDEADLTTALPAMSPRQVAWLLEALQVHDPGNPWIEHLSSSTLRHAALISTSCGSTP